MATKTYFLNFFLICFSSTLCAQSNQQLLKEWTIENETKLIEKYNIVTTKKFDAECLALARLMKFDKIKTCELFESQHINAFVFNNGHVYFSTSMMKLINNKHQWASVLAHENAHIELKHYLKNIKFLKNPPVFFPKSKYKKQLKKQEQQADRWADKKLQEYDLDASQIIYFMRRIEKIIGNSSNSSHYKISKRMKKKVKEEIINSKFGLIFE